MTPSAQRLLDACAVVEALRPLVERDINESGIKTPELQAAWDKARAEAIDAAAEYAQ